MTRKREATRGSRKRSRQARAAHTGRAVSTSRVKAQDSVDGTGVPQLGRGEKNEGVDATVVAGGDLVGDVVIIYKDVVTHIAQAYINNTR